MEAPVPQLAHAPARAAPSGGLAGELGHLLRLGLPIAGSHLANMAMQVVDMVFVGRLGAEAIGGVSIGNSLFVVFMVSSVGLLLGMDFLVARAFGARRPDECNEWLVQALWVVTLAFVPMVALLWIGSHTFAAMGITPAVSVLAGTYLRVLCWSLLPMMLFMACRQYLQARGIAGPVTAILVLANLVNALGNWLFVFGNLGLPPLGVAGSALSTLVSRWCMVAAIVAYLVWQGRELGLGAAVERRFRPDRARELLRLGGPAAAQLLVEVGVFAAATLLTGRLGAQPLAAHQIVLQVASLTFMVPLGLASAAAVRVGQALGAEQPARAARLGWLALGSGMAIMACFGLTLFLGAERILGLYTADAQVISIGAGLLLIAAVFQVADGAQVVGAGILRGTGETKVPLLANLAGHWALGLPVSVLLGFSAGWGVRGIWIGLSVGLIAVGVMLSVVWARRARALLAR